jgi:hypothetical protein
LTTVDCPRRRCRNPGVASVVAVCTRSYDAGKRRILAGTKTTVVGATSHPVPSVRLEVDDEDRLDVSVVDLAQFWKT